MLWNSKDTAPLRDIEFLNAVTDRALRDAARHLEWFCLPGGWSLFEEGDAADALYFLRSGLLGMFRQSEDLEKRPVMTATIKAGEPVGEMALLGGTPHLASMRAIRDCEVLRLPRAAFLRLIRRHPDLMEALTKLIIFRMRYSARQLPTPPSVFAVVSFDLSEGAEDFFDLIKTYEQSLGVDIKIIKSWEAAQNEGGLDQVERDHRLVFLLADSRDTHWLRACIRQADRLIFVADPHGKPQPLPLAEEHLGLARNNLVDLLFLHPNAKSGREYTEKWAKNCKASRIFHVAQTSVVDARRVGRVAMREGVGLVFSGGGARAFAHVGTAQALHDNQIQVDFFGGSSMGAIVAAGLAMGWPMEELHERMHDAFVSSNPLRDLRLPVVALTSGKNIDDRLKRHFGDVKIEDLHFPFLCLAADITTAQPYIFRTGKVRDALRASLAIPGLIPPVVDQRNHILVDGAVVNNFPALLMQEFSPGLLIGSDVTRAEGLDYRDFKNPKSAAQWIWSKGISEAPPIVNLLIRSGTMMTEAERREQARYVDLMITHPLEGYELRDWDQYNAIVSEGYDISMQAIEDYRIQHGFSQLVKRQDINQFASRPETETV